MGSKQDTGGVSMLLWVLLCVAKLDLMMGTSMLLSFDLHSSTANSDVEQLAHGRCCTLHGNSQWNDRDLVLLSMATCNIAEQNLAS